MMSRVEVISPPAVSSSTISAAAFRRSASAIASAISSAETGWIGDFTFTTSTSPPGLRRSPARPSQRREQAEKAEGEERPGPGGGGPEGGTTSFTNAVYQGRLPLPLAGEAGEGAQHHTDRGIRGLRPHPRSLS